VVNGTDFENSGSIHDNSTAKVFFEGTLNTEISGTSIALHNITVNNSANIILQIPLTINTNATFSAGDIISATNKELIFVDNATVTAAANSSHVNGPVKKIGNDIFDFPIGNGTYYAPIGISGLAGSETFTAQFFYANPTTAGFDISSKDASIQKVSTMEYWLLSRTGAIDAYVTLFWNSCHDGGITNMADMLLCHWNTTPAPDIWENIPGNVFGNISSGYITSTSKVSNFSPFTLGSSTTDNPLPISLASFSAVKQNELVKISWTTLSETNNDEFILEKSIDGINFETIANLPGAGTSTNINQYSEFDYEPNNLNYYRLAQIDYDGTKTYSKIITVIKNSNLNVDFTIKKNHIIITNLLPNNTYTYLVQNELGETIFTSDFKSQNSSFQIPTHLNTGILIVSVFQNKNLISQKKLINE
jgi:hypothetical protein